MSAMIRSRSSPAARFVKVTARICQGGTPRDPDEVGDPMGEDPGLARAGPGQDEQRTVGRRDRPGLLRVQVGRDPGRQSPGRRDALGRGRRRGRDSGFERQRWPSVKSDGSEVGVGSRPRSNHDRRLPGRRPRQRRQGRPGRARAAVGARRRGRPGGRTRPAGPSSGRDRRVSGSAGWHGPIVSAAAHRAAIGRPTRSTSPTARRPTARCRSGPRAAGRP